MVMRPSMRAGFSLAEIMIALLIIGLIMAVVVPGYTKYKERGRRTSTTASLKVLKMAVDDFAEELEGKYPEKLQDLVTKPSNLDPELAKKWEPFVDSKKIPLDGWNRAFVYKPTPGGEHEYELYSLGAKDGKEKGVKLDAWNL